MVNNNSLPIIALHGATASGKSALAMELAQMLNAEIISVDSAQIYKHMDIGTAKPDTETQQRIPHHLIDLIEPHQEYSVAKFIQDTQQAIEKIQQKNKAVILCGGTMLYFHRLFIGLSELPSSNQEIRQKLYQQWLKDPKKTHQQLNDIDPITAKRLHPNDSQRVIRALEIGLYHQPLSTLQQHHKATPIITPTLSINLNISERSKLHQQIQKRLDNMLTQGFIEEVKKLHANPKLHTELPAIRCVGYRQFWQFHDKKISLQNAYEKTLAATRQLAKRQNTWSKTLITLPNTYSIEHDHPNLLNQALKLIHNH